MPDTKIFAIALTAVLEAVKAEYEARAKQAEDKLAKTRRMLETVLDECPECSPKPGSPTLCGRCLAVRETLSNTRL